jgi:hypothetical protein
MQRFLGLRAMSELGRYSIPRLYYLATPAFILLDYFAGFNVRVAVLDDMPAYKGLYYGFCVACGAAVFLLPQSSIVVALFESTANIFITVLAIFRPYLETIRQFDNILEVDLQGLSMFDTPQAVNLLMAGAVAAFAFMQANNALAQRFERATRGQPPERAA